MLGLMRQQHSVLLCADLLGLSSRGAVARCSWCLSRSDFPVYLVQAVGRWKACKE